MSEKFSWEKIYKEIAQKINNEDINLGELLSSCEDCQTNYLKTKQLPSIRR